MLKHIVLWKLKDEAEGLSKAENLALIREKLAALVGVVPELKGLETGCDISHTEMSYDLALITLFEDAEALHAYAVHPEHVKVSQYVRKVIESRVTLDFTIED